jgi:lipoprotein-releasing system ATP-binding protein
VPTSGAVLGDDEDFSRLDETRRGQIRNHVFGFVYQFHHLLPEFTALENVAMPLLIRGEAPAVARRRAAEQLADVGLSQRLEHKPADAVFQLMLNLQRNKNTALVVTHDTNLARSMDRVLTLDEGVLRG